MSDGTRKVRVGKLDTIGGVATEMGKIYREARRGELDTLDATRLMSILCEIGRGFERNASIAIFPGKQNLSQRDMRTNGISGPNGPIPISAAKQTFISRINGIRERRLLGEAD